MREGLIMAAMLQDYKAKPGLVERMRELAGPGKHERAAELFARARELENAIINTEPGSVPKLVGAWARARRLWCQCSGEDLI